MLCECFSAVQSLKEEQVETGPTVHRIEPPGPVPASIMRKAGCDVEKSLRLLSENWTKRQVHMLELFERDTKEGLLRASEWPEFGFMDEEAWVHAFKVFLDNFELDDEDWCELLFKIWVARVLNYTMRYVIRGVRLRVAG